MNWATISFILLSVFTLARAGNWGSEGAPMPPPIPPDYEYAYRCTIEVTDQKSQLNTDGSRYILIASTEVQFDNQTLRLIGKDLSWKVVKLTYHRGRETTELKNPYRLEKYGFSLIVDARNSKNGNPTASDLVRLNLDLAQPIDSKTTIHYREQILSTRGAEYLSGEVESGIESSNPKLRSMDMQVTCQKTL